MRRRPEILIALGVLAGLALLWFAAARLDLRAFVATLRGATLWPWLPLGVASYLAGHWVRGLRCRRLTSSDALLSRTAATNVVVLGYAVNNLLPARLGEFARAGLLAERAGLSYAQTLTITALERILDGLVLLLLLAATLVWVPAHGWMIATLRLAAGVFGGAAAFVLVACLAPGMLLSFVSRATSRWAERWHDRAVGLVGAIVHGVAYLRRPTDALSVLGLSAIVWLLEAGMFLSLLPAFRLAPNPATALLAMAVTNLGILVPSSPGYVGVFHFLCMQAVTATGVGPETALGYASLVHLAFYVPITLWGVGILFAYGLSVGRAISLSRSVEPVSALPGVERGAITRPLPVVLSRPRPPSPFLLVLTEALIPLDADGVPREQRASVIADTAAFLQGQVEALPTGLRGLLGVGLLGFRVTTAITHARPFHRLAPERRRACAEAWAYGSLAAARRLFRPLRSTALLAYYELDAVRARRSHARVSAAGGAGHEQD